ncbi:MAG: hypothetical protein WCT07_04635, partial [Candidatus Paceibacterota bacterium]
FLSFSFNSQIDAERMITNHLFDYNNNQPRKEIGMMTPIAKLKMFEQFSNVKEFSPKREVN